MTDTVHAFPGFAVCSSCTRPLTIQALKPGERRTVCWCASATCEMHDVRLVLEAQPVAVRRFEG